MQAAYCFDGHSAYLHYTPIISRFFVFVKSLRKITRPKKRIKKFAVYGRLMIEYSKNAEVRMDGY